MKPQKRRQFKASNRDKWWKISSAREGAIDPNTEINEAGSKDKIRTNKTVTIEGARTPIGAQIQTPNHAITLQQLLLHMLMYQYRWTSTAHELRQEVDAP